ncbi:MAG: M20 family metallopeptidase [Candidatus Firestonebacteria bacterium]
MEKYCINLLKKLVNIESVSGHEKKIMEFIERELKSFGFSPKRIYLEKDRFNILAKTGSGSPSICLNSHADTVNPFGKSIPKAVEKNNKIYGLGSCDDKGGLSAILTVAKEISKNPPKRGSLNILISVDEETGGLGVEKVIKQGYKFDYALVGEPSDLEIVRAHMGIIFLKLKTYGVATHGSIPWDGINAIERLFNLVTKIKSFLKKYKKHNLLGPFSINLGVIKGGDRPNRVPDYGEGSVDIRIFPPYKSKDVLNEIKNLIKKFKDADFEIIKLQEPMETEKDSKFIKILKEVVFEGTKRKVIISGKRGWTEASHFRNMLGIDTIVLGPGSIKEAHSANEFVSTKEVIDCYKIYTSIVRKMLYM